jgi:hypothetical protein
MYKRLCKILQYFKPSPLGVTLSENAKLIYEGLCTKHGVPNV